MPSNAKEYSSSIHTRYFPVMPSLLHHPPAVKSAEFSVVEVAEERRLFPRMPSLLQREPVQKPSVTPIQEPVQKKRRLVEEVPEEHRFFPRMPSLLDHLKPEPAAIHEAAPEHPRLFPRMPSLLHRGPIQKPSVLPLLKSAQQERRLVEEVSAEHRFFPRMPSLLDHLKPEPAPIQEAAPEEHRFFPKMPSLLEHRRQPICAVELTQASAKTISNSLAVLESQVSGVAMRPHQRGSKPKRRWEEMWKSEKEEKDVTPVTSTPTKRDCKSFERFLEEQLKEDNKDL